jgi:predicted kinase
MAADYRDGRMLAAYEPSPPGSGKPTLATALAPELGLPLLAKDTIKQALMAALPVPDIETSQALGIASTAAMLAVAGENTVAVLESVWYRERSLAALRKLPGPVVEVFCRFVVAARVRAAAGEVPA